MIRAIDNFALMFWDIGVFGCWSTSCPYTIPSFSVKVCSYIRSYIHMYYLYIYVQLTLFIYVFIWLLAARLAPTAPWSICWFLPFPRQPGHEALLGLLDPYHVALPSRLNTNHTWKKCRKRRQPKNYTCRLGKLSFDFGLIFAILRRV